MLKPALVLAFTVALSGPVPCVNTAPMTELRVVTVDGNLFIAGEGDTCSDAWQGAVIPANWREIECVTVDIIAL